MIPAAQHLLLHLHAKSVVTGPVKRAQQRQRRHSACASSAKNPMHFIFSGHHLLNPGYLSSSPQRAGCDARLFCRSLLGLPTLFPELNPPPSTMSSQVVPIIVVSSFWGAVAILGFFFAGRHHSERG